MKKFLAFILLVLTVSLNAQQSHEKKGVLYDKELSFGAQLHTMGWGVFIDRGSRKSVTNKNLWELEFSQIHHPKETRQTLDLGFSNVSFNSPKAFVFGKQNSFFPLNICYGQQRVIGYKAEKSGVEVSLKYVGGVSLGLLKPYYLDLSYPIENTNQAMIKTEKYSEANADKFLDWTSIVGSAGFAYGIGETSVIPGIHAKVGLHFDWATYDDFVKALEAGIMVDAYYKTVPIMIIEKNMQVFPNAYVSMQFGKRW